MVKKYPKKTKAFLFSDIEGSTRLIQQEGESYALILERHRAIIRMALNQYSGQEVDSSGDSFFIVFDQADQAVQAAVLIQKTFAARVWARKLNLRVRIGLHYGNSIVTDSGYIGLEVHRASRICNAGHGGQILLSRKIRDKVYKNLPSGIALRKLGKFLLKDFDEPDELYQLIIPGISEDFPPLRTGSYKPTVAVLPFTNLSEDPEQEYFCDGIAEEIISALNQIAGLDVVPRSTSFALKNSPLDVKEKGRQLSATVVLEGTVRKIDNQLRIAAELVNTETGLKIWSERYDRLVEDVFTVQDEIARNIARALEIKLLPGKDRIIQTRQTRNIEAYDFYLKGRRFYYQFSNSSVRMALQMFKKAIEIDEEYALAYCGLADSYAYLYMYDHNSDENLREANIASLQALELAPQLAEAWAARGLAQLLKKQYKKSDAAFEKAIELNPSLYDAWYHYARASFAQGRLDKAAWLFDEANRTSPEDYQSLILSTKIYDRMGARHLAYKIRLRAISIVEKRLNLNPGNTRALCLGANALAALGRKEQALEWIQRALTLEPEDSIVLYNAACVYALLQMRKEAMNILLYAWEKGFTQKGWYLHDSNLDSLRSLPAFKTLLEKLKD